MIPVCHCIDKVCAALKSVGQVILHSERPNRSSEHNKISYNNNKCTTTMCAQLKKWGKVKPFQAVKDKVTSVSDKSKAEMHIIGG